jgi:hypothetical protein
MLFYGNISMSMFISRFARTITSFPHFMCREMALLFVILNAFSLTWSFSLKLAPLSFGARLDKVETSHPKPFQHRSNIGPISYQS